MASRRAWLSVTVELIEGRGTTVWPQPGRTFAVAPRHSFEQFATAIDDAFARGTERTCTRFTSGPRRPDGAP